MKNKTSVISVMLLALMLSTTACDSLLEVEMPGQVPESELSNPALAPTMVVGALGEFECAYGQYVATTGVLSGEYQIGGFLLASTIWGRRWRPNIIEVAGGCGGGYGYYTALQIARYMAEDGSRRIEAFPEAEIPGNKNQMLAQLAAYAGYSYTLLGEGFCEMAIDAGPLQTRQQIWAKAEEWFTKALALAQAGNDASIRDMALVGRARVRLNQGKKAEAAADAEQVTVGFVRNAGYSSTITRRNNRVFAATIRDRDMSVAPEYRNLTIRGTPDSRVRVTFANRNGVDGITPQWDQTKYTALNSNIPIASWNEAQLIIAEARGGQAGIDAINRLRTRANLPLMAAGETADLPTVLEERRRQLFTEGHRYNDMLRHNLPFATGVDHKGQLYGDVTCVPLPTVETLNNPNLR